MRLQIRKDSQGYYIKNDVWCGKSSHYNTLKEAITNKRLLLKFYKKIDTLMGEPKETEYTLLKSRFFPIINPKPLMTIEA